MPKVKVRQARSKLYCPLKKSRDTDNGDRHFSSADFSWAEDNTPCGHCDNCLRDPSSIVEKDATSEGKRILSVARALTSQNINVTALQLARAARGIGELAKDVKFAQEDKVKLSLVVRPFRRSSPLFFFTWSLSEARRTRRSSSRTCFSKDTYKNSPRKPRTPCRCT